MRKDLWWVSHCTLTTGTPQSLRKMMGWVAGGLWVDGGRLMAPSPPSTFTRNNRSRKKCFLLIWALRRERSDVSFIALALPESINSHWWNEASCVKTPLPLLWVEKSGGTQVDETPAGWESMSCALLQAFKCLGLKGTTEKADLASLWPLPPTDWKTLPSSSSFLSIYPQSFSVLVICQSGI